MKKRTTGILFNILSLAVALFLNFLATNLPLNNLTTREISDSFDIYFVPSAYVFSIWGLIYLGLLAFIVFQALPAQQANEKLQRIDGWFALSNLSNAFWLVSFHYQQFALSLALIVLLLISLIHIFLKLEIGRSQHAAAWRWAVEIPFTIYLGWVSVATIANATQVLFFYGWNGFGLNPQLWFVIILALAVLLSALMSFRRRVLAYALVLAWAFAGIALKFPNVPLVNISAWAGTAAVFLFAILAMVRKPKGSPAS